MQINNNNELRKQRVKELHYLENIKTDFQLNLNKIDRYIETRTKRIESTNNILEHFEGKPLTDPVEFNKHIINIYT